MSETVAAIVGVVVGYFLAFGTSHFERRRRLKAHWAALDVEMEMIARAAQTYRTDKEKAPLYRLPTVAFEHSLPVLVAEGAVKPAELESLAGFAQLVRDINRGLDQAAAIALRDISGEAQRLAVKCRHLLDEPEHAQGIHRVRAVVSGHVKKA